MRSFLFSQFSFLVKINELIYFYIFVGRNHSEIYIFYDNF